MRKTTAVLFMDLLATYTYVYILYQMRWHAARKPLKKLNKQKAKKKSTSNNKDAKAFKYMYAYMFLHKHAII